MNSNDIHGMALALGLPSAIAQIEAVKLLVAEAVANEREACAALVEREWSTKLEKIFCDELAAYIRARGEA